MIKRFPIWLLYSRTFALFLLAVPITAAISQPKLMVGSDFLMTFYLAGKLVLSGQANDMYPPLSATNLIDTPFNHYAHSVLSTLAPQMTAIYMYSPLTALALTPFGALDSQWAMVAWQVSCAVALLVSAVLMHKVTGRSAWSLFFASIIFLPVFHTVLIGHLGIVMGILPLALAFYLLHKDKQFFAGLAFSLLLLKPQFLPAAMLICGALAVTGRFACSLGLVSGAVALTGLTYLVFGGDIIKAWLSSFRLSDTIFSDPRYGYPRYLVTSMPGAIVQSLPMAARGTAKAVTYGLAFLVGMHALYMSRQLLIKHGGLKNTLPILGITSLLVLPVVLPHFLCYDLCVLSLAGMFIFGQYWPGLDRVVRVHALMGWLACNIYLITWMFTSIKAEPLVLVAILTFLYARIMHFLGKAETPQPFHNRPLLQSQPAQPAQLPEQPSA